MLSDGVEEKSTRHNEVLHIIHKHGKTDQESQNKHDVTGDGSGWPFKFQGQGMQETSPVMLLGGVLGAAFQETWQ